MTTAPSTKPPCSVPYPVVDLDYDTLASHMAATGIDGMTGTLDKQFKSLDTPRWENEVLYFWLRLFRAAAKDYPAVLLWLRTYTHVRAWGNDPPPYPVIGAPDDRLYDPAGRPDPWLPKPKSKTSPTAAS